MKLVVSAAIAFVLLVAVGTWFVTTHKPERIPPPPPTPLERLLCRDVAAYKWVEGTASQNFEHFGVMLLYLSAGEVYGRAWPQKSKNNWPTVRGIGSLEGDELHIVFRSAAAMPGHEFYHADCRFKLSADGRTFVCNAMQKAQAGDATPMVPSFANGELLEKLDPDWSVQVEHLRGMARGEPWDMEPGAENRERCPVLKAVASDRVSAEYNGKTYHFCCESCRSVFLGNPGAFVGDKEKK
jgi:YHS domain-containing protein